VVAISADKDVPGILDQLEPVVTQLVVTQNSSGRSMDAAELADLAEAVFGPDRVSTTARLDDAIELAVGLADAADAEGDLGGAGVLITGSVYTAGEARLLLGRSGPPEGWAGDGAGDAL
jgi:dihydrofolate synthase / folylpolyglutamate synthase